MFGRHAGKLTALPQTSLLYLSRLFCGCVGRNEQEESERRSHPLPPVHGSATILPSYGAVSLPSESSGGWTNGNKFRTMAIRRSRPCHCFMLTTSALSLPVCWVYSCFRRDGRTLDRYVDPLPVKVACVKTVWWQRLHSCLPSLSPVWNLQLLKLKWIYSKEVVDVLAGLWQFPWKMTVRMKTEKYRSSVKWPSSGAVLNLKFIRNQLNRLL